MMLAILKVSAQHPLDIRNTDGIQRDTTQVTISLRRTDYRQYVACHMSLKYDIELAKKSIKKKQGRMAAGIACGLFGIAIVAVIIGASIEIPVVRIK